MKLLLSFALCMTTLGVYGQSSRTKIETRQEATNKNQIYFVSSCSAPEIVTTYGNYRDGGERNRRFVKTRLTWASCDEYRQYKAEVTYASSLDWNPDVREVPNTSEMIYRPMEHFKEFKRELNGDGFDDGYNTSAVMTDCLSYKKSFYVVGLKDTQCE